MNKKDKQAVQALLNYLMAGKTEFRPHLGETIRSTTELMVRHHMLHPSAEKYASGDLEYALRSVDERRTLMSQLQQLNREAQL